ncbi:MAG: hypothetical protein K0R57_4104 [Paenibacillaceae bacterium]|jgi:alpha-galactosidase|nr:hypothetical protein [Paenibacillaceae bacterium]
MEKKRIERVAFIGNSITKHPAAPDLGWFGEWGMAASAPDRDYVHLMMRRICSHYPGAVHQGAYIAAFERSYWDYDLARLEHLRQFNPDLIIMKIGENVNDAECVQRGFRDYYKRLIAYLNLSSGATVICVNGFWANTYVNEEIRQTALEQGFPFVDLSSLHGREEYMAKGRFEHEGVAQHPSDAGMEQIALLIWSTLASEYGLD